MDPEISIQNELLPEERLIWAGQPNPAALAKTRRAITVPGLFLVLFSTLWLAGALVIPFTFDGGLPSVFLLFFSVPGFVALGFGLTMLLSPLWYWRKAKRMAYAVTDSRVLIIEPGRVQSFESGDIKQLVRFDKGGGNGDLIFREEDSNLMLALHSFGTMANRKIGFYGVPDVRAAENAIRDLKRSAT